MGEQILLGFTKWNSRYGELALWIYRLIFYPFLSLVLYASTAYLNSHYVSKSYFDKAMSTLSKEKAKYAIEQKQDLKEINGKLDALLLRDSANSQRFSDYERRLENVEGKVDRLQEHSASR